MCIRDRKIEMWLNGKKEDVKSNKRLLNCLKELRSRAGVDETKDKHILRIVSENNFPTAAGLASSASGFCCLVYSLAQLYGVQGDISGIARLGSGSACRSMYGGFVRWEMGQKTDGSDSIAVQVETESHWPDLEVLVLVVNDQKKDVSSTSGMQTSVLTSPLIKDRAENIVPQRLIDIEKAIHERNFPVFADLTMKDSDSFHEVCRTTTPAIHYLNDISRSIIALVNAFNEAKAVISAAYTFDAGPNAVIFLERKNLGDFISLVVKHFPPAENQTVESFLSNDEDLISLTKSGSTLQLTTEAATQRPGTLRYILHTSVGTGPNVLDASESLIDNSTNLPKRTV
eukprot:TRINITY_DN6313_c0_g1_i2.p1 TRINITY_DN6313_c0_g1~~TRINITY_DN6313_c0_g1_i2.p1  ORF type:complete len:343 (-),score=91.38 TRINITY_DN6313_c0_g1_i2:70-1098(-)